MEYHEVSKYATHRDTSSAPGRLAQPASQEARSGSLGTTYEITQPPPTQKSAKPGIVRVSGRLEKWALQSVSRVLLPGERVRTCLRSMRAKEISVWKSRENQAHYSGLMVCGSVWTCPVCAQKISERRRIELVQAVAKWHKMGGYVHLLTLTVPHYSNDALKPLLSRFSNARRKMMNRKSWKNWKAENGLAGTVRALEVTHGSNGWHVHTHELLFTREPLPDLDQVQADLLKMWQSAAVSAGLPEPNEHGLDLRNGDYAAAYAGKWGLEHELTKSNVKKGRHGSKTPWDLLRSVFAAGLGTEESIEDSELFQNYAKAFKGKRQLVWTRDLRRLLNIEEEKTDQELAEQIEETAELLGLITPKQWKLILKYNKRGEVLLCASFLGWSSVVELIDNLQRKEFDDGT